MNFNFFINTEVSDGDAAVDQLAGLAGMKAASEHHEPDLRPLPEEALAALGMDLGADDTAESPLPVEQLEAMVGGGLEAFGALEATALGPISEEQLTSMGAIQGGGDLLDEPMEMEALEAALVGGDAALAELAPMPEEALLEMMDQAGPASAQGSAQGSTESSAKPRSSPRRRSKPRAKPKAG